MSFVGNLTSSHALYLILVGIPGLEDVYPWISIPFYFVYAITLLGNSTLIFITRTDALLQMPMYDLLSMLAFVDLSLSLSTLPTVLGVFWFNFLELPVTLCLLQMFLIHSFSVMESSILLAMAYDRFLAICDPLRYSSIITSSLTSKIGFASVARGVMVLLPVSILLEKSILCKSNVLSHAFCLHPDLMRLLCSQFTANNVISLLAILLTMGLDAVLISLSYLLIIQAACRLGSTAESWKAFQTCLCHVCVVLVFYTPMITLSMIHRYGLHISLPVHAPLAYLHFLLPPALNPIMYGIKTKPIRLRIVEMGRKFYETSRRM